MEIQNSPQHVDNSFLALHPRATANFQRTANAREARWDINKRDFRSRIQTARLIRRLQKHALGQIEMNNSAVRAAIALLDRVVPVLQAVEVKGTLEHRFVLEVPAAALSSAEWEADTQSTQPDDTLRQVSDKA